MGGSPGDELALNESWLSRDLDLPVDLVDLDLDARSRSRYLEI